MTHAIGGTVTISGSYRIHTFTTSGSLVVDEAGTLEYLVVAGGGAGGADHGGGGEGGDVVTGTFSAVVGSLTITVGAGGTAGAGRGLLGTNGGSSSLGTIIALGGGRGGQFDNRSGAGGAGGASFSSGGFGGTTGATGFVGSNGSNNGAGGGAGAGGNGGVTYASHGGVGVSSSISGAAVGYGGGGGGADSLAPNNPSLGQDGGGNGNNRGTDNIGTAAAANRGGGGGGSTSQQVGTAGGSGVVIVRYLATTTTRRQIHTEDISFQSLPEFPYKGTKAGVEAIAAPVEGMRAFATDTKLQGFYNGTIWVWGSASSGHVIQDEGTPLTARANLNFIGASVTDDVGNNATVVTIGDVIEDGVAGDVLAYGDLVYLSSVDDRWELADASGEATCRNKLGMCILLAAGNGSATEILLTGNITEATFPAMTVGAPIYVSTTAGDIATNRPSANAGEIIRVVGFAVSTDTLYFNPSNDYFELGVP